MNVTPEIICLDFDETLFDHSKLNSWMDEQLAYDGLVAEGTFKSRVGAYHKNITSILRLYDHERHLLEATGKEWSFIAGHLKSKLMNAACLFCYDDSHAFIHSCIESGAEVRILSFGHGEYQRFKMSLCRVIRQLDLPIHIVNSPKAEFLKSYFSECKRGVLVDDKYPLDLPSNFIHVLADRKDNYFVVAKDNQNVVKIRKLSEYAPGRAL